MNIRWLSGTRQSMQRLGFCKALLTIQSPVRGAGEIAKHFSSLISKEFIITKDDTLLKCIQSIPGYKNQDMLSGDQIEVIMQYYYICRHPSQSGWLSDKGIVEYVEGLPRYLGLFDSAYKLTDFGRVLEKGLLSHKEINSYDSASDLLNPLLLTLPQKVFYLYSIIANDGDFFIPFTKALSEKYGTETFSYLEAGALVPDILKVLLDRFAGTGYTRVERDQLRKLRSAHESIKKAIEKRLEKQGSGSRREQTTIPRLEWLIDLGFLEKMPNQRHRRRYKLTDMGGKFSSLFSEAYKNMHKTKFADEAMDGLLAEEFYGRTHEVYLGKKKEIAVQQHIAEYFKTAYESLSGISGYCAIKPLTLLSNAYRIASDQYVLEYKDVMVAVEDAYREDPDQVYYTVTRNGADNQLKIEYEVKHFE